MDEVNRRKLNSSSFIRRRNKTRFILVAPSCSKQSAVHFFSRGPLTEEFHKRVSSSFVWFDSQPPAGIDRRPMPAGFAALGLRMLVASSVVWSRLVREDLVVGHVIG